MKVILSCPIFAKDFALEGIFSEECIATRPLNHMTTTPVTPWMFAEMEDTR
jgi:hypothetical protein